MTLEEKINKNFNTYGKHRIIFTTGRAITTKIAVLEWLDAGPKSNLDPKDIDYSLAHWRPYKIGQGSTFEEALDNLMSVLVTEEGKL